MKTNNTIRSKWMRRVSGLIAILMLTMSFSGHASARILFQDDISADVVSEGMIINSDDGGDEDVTLQLGNDTTDATITFDDGTGDVTLAAPGGDFSFSDDNLAGTGGLDFDGAIDFSGASSFTMRSSASAPANCTEGEMYYNTTSNITYMCTATDTWTSYSTGSQDFEGVYGADGDNTLTTSNGAFTINTGSGAMAIDSGTLSVDSTDTTNITMTANDAGTKTFTIDAINSGAGAGNLDINVDDTLFIDASAGGISIDGAGSSNFTTSSGDMTISATTNSVNVTGAEAAADAVRLNATNAAGGIDIDSGTAGVAVDSTGGISLDGANDSNFTMTANDAATKTLTFSATNTGAGAGQIAIATDVWDITGAGVASGFTGFTSTGIVDFSGASRLALHSGGSNPANCTEGDIFYNSTSNITYICTATDTWSSLSAGAQDFESVYSTDADKTLTASSTFDIDATGALGLDSDATVTIGGAGISVTSDGGALALTGDGTNDIDLSNAGAAIDIDSATMTIDTTSTFAINTSAWDITGAGAASGFTTFDASGNITTSGGDFIIGTTGLTETTANNDSGAYLVGIFDEFDNSAGANVQDVVDDIDAAIGIRTYSEDNVLTDNQSVAASLDALDLKWGDLGSTANGEGASLVGVEDSGGNYTATTVEGVFTEIAGQIGSNAANNEDLTFYAEYPDTVVYQDGSNNKGVLEALYDNANNNNYYRWTSKQGSTQDIDLRFKFVLPTDFVSVGNLTYQYRTNTTTEAQNDVEIYLYNVTDSMQLCDSDTTNGTANAWATNTLTNIATGCTGGTALNAGDEVEVVIKLLADNTSNAAADVGYVSLAYSN